MAPVLSPEVVCEVKWPANAVLGKQDYGRLPKEEEERRKKIVDVVR
jgi:hypothetical protein